jgi:predicted nucleotide-binding protein
LPIARKLQANLADDLSVEVWNQGTVFGLGSHTLESLEKAVSQYDFGVFVFTADDALLSRGQVTPVARDNVIFELGLFAGRLGRHRVYIVRPGGATVMLPTDLAGVTTATYPLDATNLAAALEPACEKIREAITSIGNATPRGLPRH